MAVALVAGWVLVRLLAGSATAPAPPRVTAPTSPAVVVDAPVEKPAGADAEALDGETASVDEVRIARDLEVLAEALRTDATIENRALPAATGVTEVPNGLAYRRAADFWQPAFAAKRKEG